MRSRSVWAVFDVPLPAGFCYTQFADTSGERNGLLEDHRTPKDALTARRAIIVAAGRGTRLGALTEHVPKPLLDVGGRPLLLRIIDGLAAAGITEVVVITGYRGEMVRDALQHDAPPLRVELRHQRDLDGTARAVSLARDVLEGEPFFFGWGDILVEPANYGAVLRSAATAEGALAVNEVDDPWAGAAVEVDDDGIITRIVEKPPRGTSTTRFNNAGFGVLPDAIWAEVDRLPPSPRGEYELPIAIAALVARGARMRAVPVEGPWWDIGTPADLAAARSFYM